jgi:alpha-L-rhamnosidase
MKIKRALVAGILLVVAAAGWWLMRGRNNTTDPSAATPTALTVDHRADPIGIDTPAPHLSWQHAIDARNWRQSAYQILVATDPSLLRDGSADVWDSGRQESDRSHGLSYAGPSLESGRRYHWTVRTWDNAGTPSSFAPASFWEMGLLQSADWQARWIAGSDAEAQADRAAVRWVYVSGQNAMQMPLDTASVFRVVIDLPAKPANAALLVTTRGDFVATVNGKPAGVKTRSWVAFDREDITESLVVGRNEVEVRLKTALVADAQPPANRRIPSALAGLVKIVHEDGRVERHGSGPAWQSRLETSPAWQDSAVVADLGDGRFPDPGPVPSAASLLRRTFDVAKAVRSARLYATALGSYRLFLNGERVGADVLTPEFTDYRDRVVYQTYDVTALLRNGQNVLGAMLGDGWFASAMSWYGNRFFFGPGPVRMMAQLEVVYEDGTRDRVVTDGTWKTATSPILHSEIYAGEVYDARLDDPAWSTVGFDDASWNAAPTTAAPSAALTAQVTTPVRVIESVAPASVTEKAPGVFVFDMGQNMVGWTRLNVEGMRGTRVRMRFAERLDPDGNIYRDNFRNANATGIYVLRGGGAESYAPLFTFYGFRYVEVTGFPGTPTTASLTGEVVSSVSATATGRIDTASDLVNRFWQVGVWGQKGNFLSVPTDCPQRDERLGWTGDAGAFWRTGSYNFDIAAFTRKWMIDVRDAQSPEGSVPNTAPHVPDLGDGAPGWGDAMVIVPWTSWMQYGDVTFINDNWDAMEKWMAYIHGGNADFIRRNRVGWNFSDWLAPDERTSKELVGTAYWALIADQMVQMADATGRVEAAARYRALHDNLRASFAKAFVRDDGRVDIGTQTSYVLALNMRLVPDALVAQAVEHFVQSIEERNWHLSTGFLGTPYLLFALTDNGRSDVAYRLLLNETFPSWGYMVTNNATTWWERWNSDTSDPAMNSYNHYAFGSVVAWVYRYVAGIDTSSAGPGFKQIVIHPRVDARMPRASGEYQSVYGRIATEWAKPEAGPFTMRVSIPANTGARVVMPAGQGTQVYEGGQVVTSRTEGSNHIVEIGSGNYSFEVR